MLDDWQSPGKLSPTVWLQDPVSVPGSRGWFLTQLDLGSGVSWSLCWTAVGQDQGPAGSRAESDFLWADCSAGCGIVVVSAWRGWGCSRGMGRLPGGWSPGSPGRGDSGTAPCLPGKWPDPGSQVGRAFGNQKASVGSEVLSAVGLLKGGTVFTSNSWRPETSQHWCLWAVGWGPGLAFVRWREDSAMAPTSAGLPEMAAATVSIPGWQLCTLSVRSPQELLQDKQVGQAVLGKSPFSPVPEPVQFCVPPFSSEVSNTSSPVYLPNTEYYSAIKDMSCICKYMDGLGWYYAKWNVRQKSQYYMIALCGIWKLQQT